MMTATDQWARFHTAFSAAGLAVNFFREERYASHRGLDFDLVPFGSINLLLDWVIRYSERYNTGGTGAAVTVRVGAISGGDIFWCDESTGRIDVEPFASDTSAVRAEWNGSGGRRVALFLFPKPEGAIGAEITSQGVDSLIIEVSRPQFVVPGFVSYAASFVESENRLSVEQPNYDCRVDVILSPPPTEYQVGLYGALTGAEVDPEIQWKRDGGLGKTTRAGWWAFGSDKTDETDRSTLDVAAHEVESPGSSRSQVAVRAWFVISGSHAVIDLCGVFGKEPRQRLAEQGRRGFDDEWRDRHSRIGLTEACGVDSSWSMKQVARLMSTHSRHPVHPERAGTGGAVGSCYWEWLNFRDSSQVALTLTAIGLAQEARGIYETWWWHFANGGKPFHRNIGINHMPEATCTEIPAVRVVSLFRHVLMTGDRQWAERRAIPMALWLGSALAGRIDTKTGFVLGGSQEQDLWLEKPGFDLVVQAAAIGAFDSLGRLLQIVEDAGSEEWLAKADQLRAALSGSYPVLNEGSMASRVSVDGVVESCVDIFGLTFPILHNALPLDDPRILAAARRIRSLAAPLPAGAPYWGRRYSRDPHDSDWGRAWFMMVHQGEPVGTTWMKLGMRPEAEAVLQTHLESVARDRYACAVEQEQFLPAPLREQTPDELAAREYVRSFVWGPFPWATSNPLYMLNVEGFCLLVDEDDQPVFLHANPVFAPYNRFGRHAGEFDGRVIRIGDKVLATMDGRGEINLSWRLGIAEIRTLDTPLNIEIDAPEGKISANIRPYERKWLQWQAESIAAEVSKSGI